MVKYTDFGTANSLPVSEVKIDDPKLKKGTAPYDPRFPNQNQTRYCFSSYVDFQRCKKRHSEDFEACKYFKKVYTSMCPNAWIEKWDEQLEEGTFQVKI